MSNQIELGVNEVAERIHLRLRRYLEAQYHIRNSALIEERRMLLEEPGGIAQRPYIEVTPSYAVASGFAAVNAPATVKGLLQELVGWSPGIGVFPPYKHQADALEHFFSESAEDLVVATGTGSGKTETFLYAILGALAVEGTERPRSFGLHGVRALLLYPMNALVSDQTARLRKLLGNERIASLMEERWGRRVRFGMYTSRTPYPGVRTGAKDKRHLDALFGYYEALETSTKAEEQALVAQLKQRGRWPAKDVVTFYARDREQKVAVKSGKNAGKERTLHNWGERFRTQPRDRELLTRHEMQEHAPDLLITNYSMLEYMLLRPIERPLFEQTRAWLAADPRNQFLLVLDEAHMYRGVGGAEVGLLIRRLLSRLGIKRDRLRCILTSASLGTGPVAETAGREFARDLTGEGSRGFAIVRGTREPRSGARPGTRDEASALASVSPRALAAAAITPAEAEATLVGVASRLGWEAPPAIATKDGLATRQQVCRLLTGFGPLELLLEKASGNGTEFADLARTLFPDSDAAEAERATDGLLALGTFARRTEGGREEQPLLPTRVHLMFRGLPPLYACINADCTERRHSASGALLGRLYTEPRTQCGCGARVFEILTHRDCGAAYLRAYGVGLRADFLWHERGGKLTEFGRPLHELHLFLEEPHPAQRASVDPVVIDVYSGRVLATTSTESATRLCYRAQTPAELPNTTTFGVCPACTRKTQSGGSLKIMDLATKGEQPFANLVREQFVSQLATKPLGEQSPNEGRKALLFSDGRQKAARLARDLPREVERDSFREAIALACQELAKLPSPPPVTLDETMYAAFVAVCARNYLHFFDGNDQSALIEECGRFRKDYDGDLDLALADRWRPTPPTRFRTALLRQIGDPYYSLVAACAAVVEASPSKVRLIQRRLTGAASPQIIEDATNAWLREMLGRYAFDPALGKDARLDEFGFFQPIQAADGVKQFFERLRARAAIDATDVERLRDALFDLFTRDAVANDDSGRLVVNDALVMRFALDEVWQQCVACGHLQIRPVFGGCGNLTCGQLRLEPRPPEHEYMRSRKGFFREPLRAVLRGERPVHITAEEHTAQLSQRDAGVVYATTEEFELRFQDVPLGPDKPPVDILSCTTTMEVGIDIGSLTAVGLRTVPPQRENYQQRAGRAGRRGTSISTVLMFAQGGAHDAHYFENPTTIISGPPREPRLKADNPRLARRHVNAHLLQTFFHSRLDGLTAEEQAEIATRRPGIMSAFGDAEQFFRGESEFSFPEFEQWMRTTVLTPKSAVVDEIAGWLPSAIFKTAAADVPKRFVREIADTLLQTLTVIRSEYLAAAPSPAEGGEEDAASSEEASGLLDVCFGRGILPSYAFPTDLCSFVIQEWDKTISSRWRVNVAERPQLAKSQALSEYAPGRLLVVNKQTYRVGGIFVDGPPSASPAEPLFAQPLSRYVGCSRCSYISIEAGSAPSRATEGAPCPVCRTPLFVREYLDPPSFVPEEARALREGDREQDITFASSAQLPEIAGRDEFDWNDGPGANLRHAYGEDVLLVVANKGKDAGGFSVCESCGAAWIDGDEPEDGAHYRPFLVPNKVLERDGAGRKCTGNVRRGLFLVHDFRTDLLLLRGAFRHPLDFSPEQPWLYDALVTLSEALALGASLHLDIDPGELSAGFRLLPPLSDGDKGVAEIYLFDTASGGAGYAADAGQQLDRVLDQTEELLRVCPANCERSCTKCLRHYGNRFHHARLDRRLALQLLGYFRTGAVPPFASPSEQTRILRPLTRFLELEGWIAAPDPTGAMRFTGPRAMTVAVYPALLACDAADADHPTEPPDDERRILLPDYLVDHDLPSAYQQATGSAAPARPGPAGPPPSPRGNVVELPVRELRRAAASATRGTVRLRVDVDLDASAFAVRVPVPGLNNAGFKAGNWIVARPSLPTDLSPETWMVVLRARGNFGATSADWTIAHVKELSSEDAPARLQVSYGSATGREFRPERVARDELTLAATIVCHAEEAP